jgi:DNA mismatch endonuclease Vsr
MARVRQRGTKAEQAVAVVLRSRRVAYRKNVRSLPGSPDFANKRRKWAVFVQGCFWHQHTGCGRATLPKTNAEFWRDKFAANRKRDSAAVRSLRSRGYKVVLIWECELAKSEQKLGKILEPRRVDVRQPVDH